MSDMIEEELQNVQDYVYDEYTEKNQESNNWEIMQKLVEENERYKIKIEA